MSMDLSGAGLGLGSQGTQKRGHQRIPSVVLSPSPSSESPGLVDKPMDITLTLDTSPTAVSSDSVTSYQAVIATPEFWDRLNLFLRSVVFLTRHFR